MKLNIEKKELSTITTLVSRAASNKNITPVLSGILIEASKETGLTMTATDMEIGIKTSTNLVDIIEEGTVLVDAHYFADFIKLLPDTTISIELDEGATRLNIKYGRSNGIINLFHVQEYPSLPLQNLSAKFTIPQNILKEALRKTAFAAAANHFRPVFTGVLFDILENGKLNIIASDTHRLAYYTYMLENKVIEPFNFIIPNRTVQELLRLLEEEEDIINIAFSDNNIIFYQADFILFSRLIEGQYPNYEQVIPEKYTTNVKFNPNTLVTTLERARLMPLDEKIKIQHVKFQFDDNEVMVNAHSEAIGEIQEIIEFNEISGDTDLKITFNTNYFLDIAKIYNSECEEIIIDLSGALSPAVVKNPLNENYLYVLVPLRTSI